MLIHCFLLSLNVVVERIAVLVTTSLMFPSFFRPSPRGYLPLWIRCVDCKDHAILRNASSEAAEECHSSI